jgi:micrococcal nuclease
VSIFKKIIPRFVLASVLFLLILGFFGRRVFHLPPSKSSAYPQKGLVTAVYDGDTIKVKFENGMSRRVRLIGIDAPEMDVIGEDAKFKAFMSKRFAFFHLYRKEIKLSYDQEIEDTYGRLLAYVRTEEEGLFNKFILEQGFASVFLAFPFRTDYRKEFMEAETVAKRTSRGIWHQGPYPLIALSRWKEAEGKIVSVLCRCMKAERQGKFLFLHDSGGDFSALIAQESLPLFPDAKMFEGKTLSVTGFLEEFREKPQILVLLPQQIRMVN